MRQTSLPASSRPKFSRSSRCQLVDIRRPIRLDSFGLFHGPLCSEKKRGLNANSSSPSKVSNAKEQAAQVESPHQPKSKEVKPLLKASIWRVHLYTSQDDLNSSTRNTNSRFVSHRKLETEQSCTKGKTSTFI